MQIQTTLWTTTDEEQHGYGGYERLHFESIEQSCGIEGEHQLGTAPERSPAPLHARDLATERGSH
jgi:hypothetical protein